MDVRLPNGVSGLAIETGTGDMVMQLDGSGTLHVDAEAAGLRQLCQLSFAGLEAEVFVLLT